MIMVGVARWSLAFSISTSSQLAVGTPNVVENWRRCVAVRCGGCSCVQRHRVVSEYGGSCRS